MSVAVGPNFLPCPTGTAKFAEKHSSNPSAKQFKWQLRHPALFYMRATNYNTIDSMDRVVGSVETAMGT